MIKCYKAMLINLGLVILAALLFGLSHPSILYHNGFSFLAYFAFVPLFILVDRVSTATAFLWGGLYGALAYVCFTPWLLTFHPLAMPTIALMYFLYMGITVLILKFVSTVFKKNMFIVQWIIWIAYEYVKTLGFTGFSYGVIGYTQWQITPLLRLASIFGVCAVSAIVVFPSAWFATVITDGLDSETFIKGFTLSVKKHLMPITIWLGCFLGVLIFGRLTYRDYSDLEHANIGLIQTNVDPWRGGNEVNRQNLDDLKMLSDKIIGNNQSLDLIVWPETAFVPRIKWHYKYREDYQSAVLVMDLLNFINSKNIPFLIGNNEAIYSAEKANGSSIIEHGRLDYNAALLFVPKINTIPPNPDIYYKKHLVPFTEHFPYGNIFPRIRNLLLENDTHFWEKGEEFNIFKVNKLAFGVPICFEDTFGYITREFANNGARLIVNISNDAWSNNLSCQFQHLSMAVFRAAETALPMVRSSSSGQTCFINQNGKVVKMADEFEKDAIVVNVPIVENYSKTIYVVIGDTLAYIFLFFALLLFVYSLVFRLLQLKK